MLSVRLDESDGITTMELIDEGNEVIVGFVIFYIGDTSCHIQYIEVHEAYRGKRCSLLLMRLLVDHLMDKDNYLHIKTITLDDMSDNASQTAPKRTRSGAIYDNEKLSLYTKLGCEPKSNYNSPERVCSVSLINEKLKKLGYPTMIELGYQ